MSGKSRRIAADRLGLLGLDETWNDREAEWIGRHRRMA
jgi:hypothetical protein